MLKPCAIFSDGAVLPRDREIAVFGTAGGQDEVCVQLLDSAGALLARETGPVEQGSFLVHLPAQRARTGCTLTISAGGEQRVCRDVAIGEVWLAGGQSNMELPLMNADDGKEEAAAHNDPLLRFFDVPKWARRCEEADAAFDATRWQAARPGEAAWVSAVAYWFGKKRRADTGVPVGIIDCWWGGTSVTCWMSPEMLQETAAGQAYLLEDERKSAGITMEEYLAKEEAFQQGINRWNDRVARARETLPPGTAWPEIEAVAGPCPWYPPAGPGSPYRPAGLYDTMLRRVMPARLTGVLYYQGEEDTERTDRYDLLMAQLIALWRRDFRDPELPFLFVQLPGWGGSGNHEAWPQLRLQQEQVYRSIRGTGLAVTIDLGEKDNLHPTDKRPVGERLAEQALITVDGKPGQESPRILGARWRRDHVMLVLSAPVEGTPAGFELMDRQGRWHACRAWRENGMIRLESPEACCPAGARYAFADWPESLLRGENGLPLAPWMETIKGI